MAQGAEGDGMLFDVCGQQARAYKLNQKNVAADARSAAPHSATKQNTHSNTAACDGVAAQGLAI
ncbi:MAG: hypothetical protein ACT6FG_05550 [Methanosarcinaceae archaeon]